jgi:hypothetical protein
MFRTGYAPRWAGRGQAGRRLRNFQWRILENHEYVFQGKN